MIMRKAWLHGGWVVILGIAACGGSESSSGSDDAADGPDASAAVDDSTDDSADDDSADDDGADDDSADDDSDDSVAEDDDDSATDDGTAEDDDDAAADDRAADDDTADEPSEGGASAPDGGGQSDAEAPSDAETDDAAPDAGSGDSGQAGSDDPDSVVVEGEDGGLGIEITFSGEGVECGMERCRDANIEQYGIGATGCCVDEENSVCGLNMSILGLALGLNNPGCERLDAPGSADDSCPASEPVPVLIPDAPQDGVIMTGCCLPSGSCGFAADFGDFGFGCVEPSRFGQESSGSCEYQETTR